MRAVAYFVLFCFVLFYFMFIFKLLLKHIFTLSSLYLAPPPTPPFPNTSLAGYKYANRADCRIAMGCSVKLFLIHLLYSYPNEFGVVFCHIFFFFVPYLQLKITQQLFTAILVRFLERLEVNACIKLAIFN